MNGILKILQIILKIILPQELYSVVMNRIKRSKDILLSTRELRLFFFVLIFPIKLIISLFIVFIKLLLCWMLPTMAYGNLKYLLKQIYSDIYFKNLSIKTTIVRARLFLELVILGREKRISYGAKNPDKIFFVIRPYYFMEKNELATSVSNLLFHYYRNLQHLSYAIENNWIPVVDWENYGPFPHQEKYLVNNTNNCWEYYWKQPSEYTLDEVYESKNVILSDRNSRNYGYIPTSFITPPFINYVKLLAQKCPKYDVLFELNETTKEYIFELESKLFSNKGKILGVSIRGASYNIKKVDGHPVQPTSLELIENINELVKKWNIDNIFFTCESKSLVEEMKKAFQEKLIVIPRMRYSKVPGEVYDGKVYNPLYENGNRYQSNLDYLTEMVLLSRCDSLVAGMSSGVRAAIIWNSGKYENIKIFDKGLW